MHGVRDGSTEDRSYGGFSAFNVRLVSDRVSPCAGSSAEPRARRWSHIQDPGRTCKLLPYCSGEALKAYPYCSGNEGASLRLSEMGHCRISASLLEDCTIKIEGLP